jgi:hypothetical protein
MSKLTKQGLRASLETAVEFGFRSHENGNNLQKTLHDCHADIEALVDAADNLPTEIMRISFRKPKGQKVSHELRGGQS